jgi:iron(III) transport system substrate-binding protein
MRIHRRGKRQVTGLAVASLATVMLIAGCSSSSSTGAAPAASGSAAPSAAPSAAASGGASANASGSAAAPSAAASGTTSASASASVPAPSLAASGSTATDCGGTTSGSITWYTSEDLASATSLAKEFTSVCHVSVSVQTTSTLALWQRFQQEQASGIHKADVLSLADAGIADQASTSGLVAKLDPSLTGALGAQFVDPSGYWFCSRVQVISLAYNTKDVSAADVPKTYADLLDPKWKGKIAVGDPASTTSAIASGWQIVNTPGLGLDYIKQLAAQKPGLFAHSGLEINAIVSGQYPIGLTVSGSIWSQVQAGAPIAEAFLAEGSGQLCNQNMLVAKAPNPAGAKAFLTYLASPDGMAASGKLTLDAPPLTGVPAYPAGRTPLSQIKLLKWGGETETKGEPALAKQLVSIFGG